MIEDNNKVGSDLLLVAVIVIICLVLNYFIG